MSKQLVSTGRVARCGNSRLAGSLGHVLVESVISEQRAEAEQYLSAVLGVIALQAKKASGRRFA